MQMSKPILWGVRLSPFLLKLEACLTFKQIDYSLLPSQGSLIQNLGVMKRLEEAKKKQEVARFPAIDAKLDEYPAVPFFSEDGQTFQYDSSSIARWLDHQNGARPLFPKQSPAGFIAHFIDEAFDEFGLYLVHHMRWVGSAKTQIMGQLLAKEFKHALPPGGPAILARQFPKRQVRRCPYLFSVAPKGFQAGVRKTLTPPSREGFPETHTLLNQSWKRIVKAVDEVLQYQPYLLGQGFTIADASVYGQLAMNLVDREAADQMLRLAPTLFNWLKRIEHGEHRHDHSQAIDPEIHPRLSKLLNSLMGTFSALMVQNEQAYEMAIAKGETQFNEVAFNQGRALYDGKLLGYPFRSVVKTFQVRVWRELKAHWQQLDEASKQRLITLIEATELFEEPVVLKY